MVTGALIRRAVRGSLRQVRHVSPVPSPAAEGTVARVYQDVEVGFGMLAPPVALHSPAPDVLAATWLLLRESLVVDDAADRVTKESVAVGVSRANTCPYCVEIHEIAEESVDGAADPAAAWWAQRTGRGAGRIPATGRAAVELGAVATTFHYLNRMVTVFLDDSPLPPAVPGWARSGARRMLGGQLRPREPVRPGELLDLLPAADLPVDLSWAAPHTRLAATLAGAAAVFDGSSSVPPPVRTLLGKRIGELIASPPGPGRSWVVPEVSTLDPSHRPVAMLALRTACTPHQIVESDVDICGLTDRELVEVTGWASFTAARTIMSLPDNERTRS